jgi:hypothetical protein
MTIRFIIAVMLMMTAIINVIVPMKFLTVSVYDAEYLIVSEMANCHKEKIGNQIILQDSSRTKNSFIDFGLSQSALIIGQHELITFYKEAPPG